MPLDLSVENGQFFINMSNGYSPCFALTLPHKYRSKTKQRQQQKKNYHKDKVGTRRGEQIK